MLQAMNTGHDGSLVTVHANNADDAVSRLETLASMSELQIPYAALRDQINSAVDLIVQLTRGADGSRRISEIAAVTSRSREEFTLARVLDFEADPLTADRRVTGRFRFHPVPFHLAQRMWLAGHPLPDSVPVMPDPDTGRTRPGADL